MIKAALALSLALTAQSLPAHPGDHEVASKPRVASKQAASKGSSSKKKDKPAWDVNTAHGPSHRIEFAVDEATWMTVDIDPRGELLVIDILGDLYTLPSSGGTATRITSGPAYDCQPRFSPDGKWIAFTSDRGGSDDLWITHPDGTNPRQISHDDDITVSCSAWSPDGNYLIGRKRLTDTSSLGTVELWLYHLDGGKGVQLTKKDELPDANDPVFSPDGRMLYYSARHSRYQYDRDPLEGIWQIERRDTTTGETIALTGAPGGACRPQVSPDSKTLAFLRRDRTETQLVLQDLATGAQRLLDRRMERDLMEGFAQGGTAPWFAWAPDGGSLITSAQGRIVRIDAKSGGREPIPFKAHVAQDVVDALRFPVDLHGATFDTKINRWPSLSHDGSTILFSALGKL